MHDSAVSSVSIVSEGTLDLDEVKILLAVLDLGVLISIAHGGYVLSFGSTSSPVERCTVGC